MKQNRFRSWALWLSVSGALWVIASLFGLPKVLGIDQTWYKQLIDAIGTILIGFGILNNPTDKENF